MTGPAFGQPASATRPAGVATQPAVEPEAEPPPPAAIPLRDRLQLTYLDADVQFDTLFDWRRVEFPLNASLFGTDRHTQTDRVWWLRESVGVQTAGTIWSPDWAAFTAAMRLGLDHTFAREEVPFDHFGDHDTGSLQEYDFTLLLRPNDPVHLNAYASRVIDRVNRLFLPSLLHTGTRVGASLIREDERFPMELTFEQMRDNFDGSIDAVDDELVEETLLRYAGTLYLTPYHQVRIDAEWQRQHQQYFGSLEAFDTDRKMIRLNDSLQFGGEHQHLWELNLEYEQDDGDLPRDRLYLDTRVAMKHSEQFRTEYKYQYSSEQIEDIELDQHRFDWIGLHKTDFGLTTTGNLFAGYENADEPDSSSSFYGGSVRWQYGRDNRYGRLSGMLGYHFTYARSDFENESAAELNETVTFRGFEPSWLLHENIVVSSIRVTNLARGELYASTIDYLIVNQGNRTALVRLPFGRIEEGQAVRVSYRYRTVRDLSAATHQIDARVQQDFKNGWTPYYQTIVRRQDLDRDDSLWIEENNLNIHKLGLTYRRQRWLVGGEFEYHDETVDPFDAIHGRATWTAVDRPRHQLNLRAALSQYWYRGDLTRRPTVFDIGTDYHYALSRRADLTTTALYRYEHDTVFGTTQGIDLSAGLAYRVGLLTLSWELEYDRLNIGEQQEDGVGLWFKVRRDFPDLLGKRDR